MSVPLESFELGDAGWTSTEGEVITPAGEVSDERGLFRMRIGLEPIAGGPDLNHCPDGPQPGCGFGRVAP